MVSATGIVESRKPRDIPCLILFIAFYVFIVYLAVNAKNADGVDLDRTYWPLDYYGRFCGKDASFNELPFKSADGTPTQTAICLAMDTGRKAATGNDFYSEIKDYLDQSDRKKLWWPLVVVDDKNNNSNFNVHETVCVSDCPVITKEFQEATKDIKDYTDVPGLVGSIENKTTMVCHRDIRDLGATTLPVSGITTLDVVQTFAGLVSNGPEKANWASKLVDKDNDVGYGATGKVLASIYLFSSGDGPRGQKFGLSGSSASEIASSAVSQLCFYAVYSTEDYNIPGVKDRCLPSGGISVLNSTLASYLDGVLGLTTSISTAVRSTLWIIIGSAVAALIFGFVWLLLLRVFAFVVTWIMLIGLLILLTYGTYAIYMRGKRRLDACSAIQCNDDYKKIGRWFTYGAYVLGALDFLYLCFLLFMRSRISLAITVTVEAGKAIGAMKHIVLVPIPFILVSLVVVGLITICAYWLWGSGEFQQEVGHRSFEGPLVWKFLLSILAVLWAIQFVSGIQIAVIAGSVVSWYWRRDRRGKLHAVVMKSLGRVLLFHLGSIAFGSFLVALIQWIRFLLRYFQKKSKALKENATAKFILNCVDCCLKYCEKILKYVNRNAYIYMAIYGTNYITSAAKSFVLLMQNILRVFAINTVGDFLLFVGKLFIAGANGTLVYIICQNKFENTKLDDSVIIIPTVISALLGYIIGDMFMNVYETTVDTILFSFIIDEKEHDGSEEKPYYMTAALRKVLSHSEKSHARKANAEGQKTKKTENEEERELANVAESEDSEITEPDEPQEKKKHRKHRK